MRGLYRPFQFKTNHWISDDNIQEIWSGADKYYPSGFHFYHYKKDAKIEANIWNTAILRKVRTVVASGTTIGAKIGVAKEIFIKETFKEKYKHS